MLSSKGFTLVELVITMLILGIVSVYVAPKFFSLNDYRERTAYDEVAGAVRYAQKFAVASGCDVQVHIAGNSYALQQRVRLPADTACGTGAFATLSGHPVTGNSLAAVTLASTAGDFTFDGMGRSAPATTVNINGGSKSFAVIAETGYVDAP